MTSAAETRNRQRALALSRPPLRTIVNGMGMKALARVGVGLNRLFGSRAGARVGFVTYHRTTPHVPGLPPPHHNVDPHRFREHLTGLLARGFTVWPLSRVLESRKNGDAVPPRTIVITFDDGFEAVYHHAWPVMKELGVPATMFVSTWFLDRDDPFPFDEWGVAYHDLLPPESYRPLTTAQCREMQQDGLMELGSHTHTHRDLRDRPDEFVDDVRTSVQILRSRFALTDVTFALPWGSPHEGFAGPKLHALAREAGVVCSLTTEVALVDPAGDPFGWGRFNAFDFDTSATLATKLDGWYDWAPRWKHRIKRALRFGRNGSPGERGENGSETETREAPTSPNADDEPTRQGGTGL